MARLPVKGSVGSKEAGGKGAPGEEPCMGKESSVSPAGAVVKVVHVDPTVTWGQQGWDQSEIICCGAQ